RVDRAKIPKLHRRAIVQTHCHHHSIMRFDSEAEVMKTMGLDYEVLNSGCCGMAGSFGFEKDKFEVSQACAERVLMPRVRDADPSTFVIADGFSCKTQIAVNGARRAIHLAEALALAIDHGPEGPAPAPFAESAHLEGSQRAMRRSMTIAGAIAIGLFLLLIAIVAALTLQHGL
ncbi:MAG: FAD-binding oxidoreductase, partial [Polyangiaceae bacterium]